MPGTRPSILAKSIDGAPFKSIGIILAFSSLSLIQKPMLYGPETIVHRAAKKPARGKRVSGPLEILGGAFFYFDPQDTAANTLAA